MAKYKITTLSPVHIGSGDEYEINYNLLYHDGFVYIYDEFKIAEFFISKNIEIPTNLATLKENIQKFNNEIIVSNLHKRKIASSFGNINKPLLEQVSSQNNPIVTGSSIKGAIRTAYIYKMVQNGDFTDEQNKLQEFDNQIDNERDFNKQRDLKFKKKDHIKKIDSMIANKTKTIFRNLKISDSFTQVETQVVKSINIKKEKSHQSNRSDKVQQIANFVETIKQNQQFFLTIDISDQYFSDLKNVCNGFYKQQYEKELENYFLNKVQFKKIELKENQFLLNIGRFGGAELKSVEEIRSLPKTGADVEWETSARTFALTQNTQDSKYFENSLVPFGWLLCELVG
jgi:CRISPR-associated protein Csm5